jgi:polyisoprenoid-binding protein YceI
MFQLLLFFWTLGLTFQPLRQPNPVSTHLIQPSKSSVRFSLSDSGTVYSGSVPVLKGKINMNGNVVVGGRVELNARKTWVRIPGQNLESKPYSDSARSARFLHSKRFPVIIFELESCMMKTANEYILKGNLIMHGKTISFTFPGKAEYSSKHVRIFGRLEFDRTFFGITHRSVKYVAGLGNLAIPDLVRAEFNLYADRKP